MQRRAFLSVAGISAASLSGCVDALFGGDDDETDEPDGPVGDGTVTTPTDGDDGSAEVAVVHLRDQQFDPRNLSVERGATVRWVSEDAAEHTVTSASDNWNAEYVVPPDQSREHTFEADGVYDVYCSIHGAADLTGMAMKIAVGDAEIDEPLPDDNYPY